MLCPRCFTPLVPTSSRSPMVCRRCGHVATNSSYSLAMATIVRDGRFDTQPSVPIAIPDALTMPAAPSAPAPAPSSSSHHSLSLWEEALTAEGTHSAWPQIPRSVAAEPYTLARLIDDVFGPDAPLEQARAGRAGQTRLQRLLVGALGARGAASKRISAVTSGLLATLVALGGILLAQLGVSALLAATLSGSGTDPTTGFMEGIARTLLGGGPFQLLALANALPLLLVGAPEGAHLQFGAPLTSLALIPALALLLGGAVAGSSDFARRGRYSAARGALIGPVYALLLTALTVLAGGQVSGAAFGVHGSVTLIADPQTALFYGALWGCLLGALGGWLQLYGRRSLRQGFAALARLRFRRLIGACVGAATALLSGLIASLAVAIAVVVYLVASGQALPQPVAQIGQALHQSGSPQSILQVVALAALLAPSLAIWAFALLSGMPLDLGRIAYAPPAHPGSDALSLGLSPLLGATQAPPQPEWYLLALIPLAYYFLGGRVAARFTRVNGRRAAFVTSALTAVPLAIGTFVLCSFASLSLQAMVPAGVLIVGVGPATLPGLALVFVAAALVAGLGGCTACGSRR